MRALWDRLIPPRLSWRYGDSSVESHSSLRIETGTVRPDLPDGELVVCPSKPEGVDFLVRNYAWGFVRFKRNPPYFALYVSSPRSRIEYFGEINRIVDPRTDGDSPLATLDQSRYKDGLRIIQFKPGTLISITRPIPMGKRKPPQSPMYSTLDKLRKARNVDDLRSGWP